MNTQNPEQLTTMINTAVDAVLQDAIDLRRFLHQQPELSGSEEKTARRHAQRWLV